MSEISPEHQAMIDQYGVGSPEANVIMRGYQSGSITRHSRLSGGAPVTAGSPAPVRQRPLTTELDVVERAGEASEALRMEIAADQGTFVGAREQADDRIQDIVSPARTASGERASSSAVRSEDIQEMNTIQALWSSFLPQIVGVGGDLTNSLQQQAAEIRDAMVQNAQRLALRQAAKENIPAGQRPEFIQERSRIQLGKTLNNVWGDMYRQHRTELMTEAGLDPEESIPSSHAEITNQAAVAARSEYDNMVGHMFGGDPLSSGPDDSNISQTWYGRSLQWITSREGQLQEIAERVRDGEDTGWDEARLRWHRLWRKRDDTSGEVAETITGAVIRDAIGIVAPVAYGVFRAATWERNPETGLPYNENDINYRISNWMDKLIVEMENPSTGTAERVVGGLASLVTAPFRGAYNIEDSRLSTDNWVKDFAIAHSYGEFTGTQIGRLQSVNALSAHGSAGWSNYGTIAGLGIDAGWFRRLPSISRGVGRATEITNAQLLRISEAAGTDRLSTGLRWVEKAAAEGDSVSSLIIKWRLGRDLAEEGGILGSITGRLLDGSEAVFSRMTRIMADDLGTRIIRSATPEDLSRLIPTLKKGSMLDNIVQEVFIAQHRMRNIGRSGGIAALKGDTQGRNIYQHMVNSSKALPNAPPEVLAHATVKALLEDKLAVLVQKHTPNDWVFVNSDTIVRSSAWTAHSSDVNRMTKDIIDHTTILSEGGKGAAGTRFVYKNKDEAANALVSGLRGEGYTGYWRKIAKDIRAGKAIEAADFMRVNDMVMGHVTRQIINNAVEASEFSSTLAVQRTIGRDLRTLNEGRDILRALKALGGASSDYKWILKKQKGGFGSARPNVNDFVSTSPPRFRRWFTTSMNELGEIENTAEKLVRSAVEHNDIQKAYAHVSSGDVAVDYRNLIDIFWKSNNTSSVIGGLLDESTIMSAVRAGGKTVTPDGARRVLAEVRERLQARDLASLNKTGLRKRVWYWPMKMSDQDNIKSLMSAYVVYGLKEKIWVKALKELTDHVAPDLLMIVPDKVASGARRAIFSKIMRANGLSNKHIRLLRPNLDQMLKSAPADKRVIATAVIKHMFEEGGLAATSDIARMTQAVRETVAWIATHADEATGVQKQFQSSYEGMRQVLRDAVKVDPSLGTVDDILEAAIPAVVKAVSDLDINGIRSRFATLGLEQRAGFRGADDPRPSQLVYEDFKEAGRFVIDQRMNDLFTRLQKPAQLQKINDALSSIRPSEREKMSWFIDILNVTKRTTVTGLLGGGALFGTRFFGTNNLSHSMIAAVTSPDYVMASIKAVPEATGGSVLRAMKKSGWGVSEDVYDWQRARYVMKPDDIMFTTPSGETWTKHMFDEAVSQNSLRFSQLSHEFSQSLFQGVVRASNMGPNKKSLRDLTILPWSKEAIPRGRYWAFLRPDMKSIYTMIGEEADNIQREAIFRAALKNGAPVQTAALLAQNSMLDYGRIATYNSRALTEMSKKIAFFSFMFNMTREVGEAIVRDGRALTNIRRTFAIVNAQRESMEQWVLEPDHAKFRIQLDPVLRHFDSRFETYGEEFGRWETKNVGIQIPFGEHWSSIMRAANSLGRVGTGDLSFLETFHMSVVAFLDLTTSDPRVQVVKDLWNAEVFGDAPAGYAPSGSLDAFAMIGRFDKAVDWFDLREIDAEDERPDMARFNGHQYRFGSDRGARAYNLWKMFTLTTAMHRNLTDYPRLAYRMGWVPEGVEPRRDAEGHPFMFAVGGTVVAYPNAQLAMDKIYRSTLRDLNDQMKD